MWREKLFLNMLQTSSIKSSTSIYTRFMTLNTFIQYKFENTGQKKKKTQQKTVVKLPLKHHIHSCKFQPSRKPAASFGREANDEHTSGQKRV